LARRSDVNIVSRLPLRGATARRNQIKMM